MKVHTADGNMNWHKRIWTAIKHTTVEPALFIIYLGAGLDHSTLDQMFIQKSCKLDFDFNDTICDNLLEEKYDKEHDQVSDEVGNEFKYPKYEVYLSKCKISVVMYYGEHNHILFLIPFQSLKKKEFV